MCWGPVFVFYRFHFLLLHSFCFFSSYNPLNSVILRLLKIKKIFVSKTNLRRSFASNYIVQITSVSEWKYIIASAFKFKLLRQPEAAGCSPDHNGQGYNQLGGNQRRLVDIFILAVALTIMVRATASWAETCGTCWIFLLSSIFRFSIAVSRLVLQHRK